MAKKVAKKNKTRVIIANKNIKIEKNNIIKITQNKT